MQVKYILFIEKCLLLLLVVATMCEQKGELGGQGPKGKSHPSAAVIACFGRFISDAFVCLLLERGYERQLSGLLTISGYFWPSHS